MRKEIKNKKVSMSITLDQKLLEILNENITNKSKYVVNIMIEDMCKNEIIKQELKDKKIIL